MKFEAITTEALMRKLALFIARAPAEKADYARARSALLNGPDLSELSDEVILGHLLNNESQMQQFVDQYEKEKAAITPGLALDSALLAMTNEFVNVAVTAAIESVLQTLEPQSAAAPARNSELVTAIDTLFSDKDHLREKLQLIQALIKKPALISNVVYTNTQNYNKIYFPVTGDSIGSPDELYGVAFLSFMGVELCMLIHQPCLDTNTLHTPKVAGFSHEFFLYVVLHELTHLLLDSDDKAYVFKAEEKVEDFNLYSMANLNARDITNADNYTTLIFIALAILHKEGRLDLRQF